MSTTVIIVLVAIAVLLVVLLAMSVKVVKQYEEGVVFRFGKVTGLRHPGLRLIIPFVEVLHRVSLRIVTMPIQSQGIITRDNVSVDVSAVAYFRVVDPIRSVVAIENPDAAINQIAQTTLRKVVGQHTLDETLSETDAINLDIRSILDVATVEWGIEVTLVELKDIQLPDSMKRAMARQAEAEREKRAKIINAEGEALAAAALGEASDTMMAHPIALQLRNLQSLVEIGVDKNTVVVFPAPLMSTIAELGTFLAREGGGGRHPRPHSRGAAHPRGARARRRRALTLARARGQVASASHGHRAGGVPAARGRRLTGSAVVLVVTDAGRCRSGPAMPSVAAAPATAAAPAAVGAALGDTAPRTESISPRTGAMASSSGSRRASLTIRRGSYWRGSYCRQLMSSYSGPELVLELVLGALGHDPQPADAVRQLGGVLRHPVGAEHEHGDQRQQHDLPAVHAEHRAVTALSSTSTRRGGHPAEPSRTIVTSCSLPPRRMVRVTLSPTVRARMATTSSPPSETGLPSNAMTTSPALRPARSAGPSGLTAGSPLGPSSAMRTPSPV